MSDHGSPDTVEVGRDPQGRPRWTAAAVVVALVVTAYVAVRHISGGHDAAAARPPSTPSVHPGPPRQVVERPPKIVPWRDLRPGRPVFRRNHDGLLVTPYDDVTATGIITG